VSRSSPLVVSWIARFRRFLVRRGFSRFALKHDSIDPGLRAPIRFGRRLEDTTEQAPADTVHASFGSIPSQPAT
jgi:hypothetical protein